MIVLRNVSCNIRYWKKPVDLEAGFYANNRLALYTVESAGLRERVSACTVNMVDSPCPENEVWIKEWSENEGITEFLIGAGVILPCATDVETTGYVNVLRYALTPKFLEALALAREKEASK